MAAEVYIGLVDGKVPVSPLKHMLDVVALEHRPPLKQWWLDLRSVIATDRLTGDDRR